MNVLVTGFEPWAHHRSNPSGILAAAVGGIVLPTRYRDSERALLRAVRERQPDAVLMLGLAESRKSISIELIAVNVDHAEGADNAGERRERRTIDPRGPLALPTRLPVKRMLSSLEKEGIPAAPSHHAGTFCCNHIFYFALRRLDLPCGFIHVPPFRTISRSRQIVALGTLIKTLKSNVR